MAQSLPPRLDAVLRLVTPCSLLADVATDHGLLAVAAVTQGVAQRALACDLRAAPLQVAKQAIERRELSDVVSTARGDGLLPLEGSGADALVIAGLNGELVVRILERGEAQLRGVTQVVIQPNRGAELVRAWGRAHGWHLRDETMAAQRERTYVVMAFVPGTGPDPAYVHPRLDVDALGLLGPHLLRHKDAVARSDYARQAARLARVVRKGGVQEAPALALWETGLREIDLR
jgi:tRNA (adenine22-N1)-methyltransferase